MPFIVLIYAEIHKDIIGREKKETDSERETNNENTTKK